MANDKYIEVITSEHRDKTNFMAWLTNNLNKVEDVYKLLSGLSDDFDIDKAIGNQLDILGLLVGRSRRLDFQPSDGSSAILDDDTYRQILKAKILQNQWDGTIPHMIEIFHNIFPDFELYITDNQDMTMRAMVIGVDTPLEVNLIQEGYYLPKSMGVTVSYEVADIVDSTMYMAYVAEEGSFETINELT